MPSKCDKYSIDHQGCSYLYGEGCRETMPSRVITIQYHSGMLYLDKFCLTQESGCDVREIPFDCSDSYSSVVELIAALEEMQGGK